MNVIAWGKYQSAPQTSVYRGWSSGLQCQFYMIWCWEMQSKPVLSFTRQQQSFFINTDLWSLHKIIMVMDLVTYTWGLAGKCWCKNGSESSYCFSVGSLSPPTVQSRGLTSWWCLEKAGFHPGSNAWAIMKRFLGLFLCTYRVKFEHVSKHCSVQEQHLPLSVVSSGLFISPASAA